MTNALSADNTNQSYINNLSSRTRVRKEASLEDIEQLRHQDAKLNLEGVVYEAYSVNVKKKSETELLNEEITYDKKVSEGHTVVTFDDPSGKKEPITLELSFEAVAMLRQKFDDKDFYDREDGIMRLNGKAQKYVASWYNDIANRRGYTAADTDKNGKIEGSERENLRVGFERDFDYDYIGEKIVNAHSYIAGETYMKYSDTLDFLNEEEGLGGTYIFNQTLGFEETIEEELDVALQSDKNGDKIITLQEGLSYKAGGDGQLYEKIINETAELHRRYMQENNIKPNEDILVNRKIEGYKKPDEDAIEKMQAEAQERVAQTQEMLFSSQSIAITQTNNMTATITATQIYSENNSEQ